jgi:AhpD family alkylhydroperoxidase
MQARLDPRKAAPDAMKAISDLHVHVRESRLDHKLLELIKMGASQINSRSCCMDMQSKELRAVGETSAFISSAVRTKN